MTLPTILVVDDVSENIDILSGLLREEYVVRAAINGELALRLAIKEPVPDLILLDVMMPGMDGYEVCRRLKDHPVTRDIPIIFVTAMGEASDELHGLELGAVDYLTKPIVPAILRARGKTHICLRQARQELQRKNLILNDEKELLEDIVTRMRSSSPIDCRGVRYIQKSLERTCGDIVLSAYRKDGGQHVVVGDFSGHGLPAAFAGPLVSYIFCAQTAQGRDLASILTELNRVLYRQLPAQLFMAVSALDVSPDRGQVQMWNYGLPPVLCFSADQALQEVGSRGLPLGACDTIMDACEPHAIITASRDMHIYQYSDGVTEASCGESAFGLSNLKAALMQVHQGQHPLEYIWDKLQVFCKGTELADDAVVVETSLHF